jgi:hypothetical protein
MAYTPSTDFLALLRRTSGGVRSALVPGMDYVVAALARASMFAVSVSQTEPTTDQATTIWVRPALPNSWAAEAAIFIYNTVTSEYEPATPALWASVLSGSGSQIVQEITVAGPVNIAFNASVVKVNQAVSAPITLVMPLALVKSGGVLVSDWKGDSGANPITVQMSGADKLPSNRTDWTIQGDGGSLYFRPIPGGYAI